MKKQVKGQAEALTEELEKLYICTYREVYRHIRLTMDEDKKTRELLIETYKAAYVERAARIRQKDEVEWLKGKADELAKKLYGMSDEDITAARAEERMHDKDSAGELCTKLDETSVFLEIEDRLPTEEQPEAFRVWEIVVGIVQVAFSLAVFVFAAGTLVFGVARAKNKLDELRRPFLAPLDGAETTEQRQERRVKVGDRVAYLSEIGEVLYSLPLDETDLADGKPGNPEVQTRTDGTYYLPCPEREDTQLADVSPALRHTLYRMRGAGKEIEIIEAEVDDFAFWEDELYVLKYGRILHMDVGGSFERQTPGLYVKVRDNEFYLYDDLGRVLKTSSDGNIYYEDRVFQMSSNRILEVSPAARIKGMTTYERKTTEGNRQGIYRKRNGREELFVEEEITIDSFCISGDWLYYSAYIRKGGSGADYSRIFRKSLVGYEEREAVSEEFPGRMTQMYFCEENKQIYAEYFPESWKNYHGVIAVISPSGQISSLKDREERSVRETSGNDALRFLMMRDGLVYCYWEDHYWQAGEEPVALWRDVLVIPSEDRVYEDE